MLAVDSAVDAQGRSRIAARILEQWEHDPESARFFRSSANFVYTFRKADERYFLRFADSAERSEAEISAELALLRWLAQQGLLVPTPIASKRGRWMETVETDLGTFHAVVFAALRGAQLEIDELSETQFELWGASLGKLHAAMRRYQGSEVSARRTWKGHLTMVRSLISENEPRVQAECDYLTTWLSGLPMTETNYGLIHGDFELDNLFWSDGALGMLDFDDCAYSWYAADIALALRDLFETGVDLRNPSLLAFIRGYAQHASIDDEVMAQLSIWLRLANLIIYAKLMRALDLDAGKNYPEDFISLQRKLQRWADNYSASLLAIPL
ncbi:MAG TPA: phosphotransferase [Ktedonobacterales bacterium]|nr:phosphotransferase [Ktedonobacterales bacterium]